MSRAAIVLALLAGIAHAEHDAIFAREFGGATVRDTVRFELPAGLDTTHIVLGKVELGGTAIQGGILLDCKQSPCTGRRIEFGVAETVELHGVVDLHGPVVPFPARALPPGKVPGRANMKFPVMIVRVTESDATKKTRRTKLYVISLLDVDRASTVLMDTADETKAGKRTTRTYKLDAGDTKPLKDAKDVKDARLDLVATERTSGCTEPTEHRFTLEEHHFRTKSYTPGKGC